VWAYVDTGFDGYLGIPRSQADRLGTPDREARYRLADGSPVTLPVYFGTVEVSGLDQALPARIMPVGDEYILGRAVIDRVPVPAMPDPTPNGPRNQAVAMGDVLAVLFYVGTYDGDAGSPNPNGVTYDSDKMGVGTKAGRDYDRSPSAEPNPPWGAGPPNGAVTMADVLAVLAQVGLDCSGPP
jgi:hypothetical protein